MYIAVVPNRASPPAILLRESFRERGKVKNRTLANLSGWPGERILPSAARNRIHVMVARMREAGLRDALIADDSGYFLDPSLCVRIVAS